MEFFCKGIIIYKKDENFYKKKKNFSLWINRELGKVLEIIKYLENNKNEGEISGKY